MIFTKVRILGDHLGIDKCLGKLKEKFYWLGQYNDVKQWCSTCVTCAARKSSGGEQKGSTSASCCRVSIAVGGSGYSGAPACDEWGQFLHSGGRRLFYKMA